MKKILLLLALSIFIGSCKTSQHVKCDAYSQSETNEEYDIHRLNVENAKKYNSIVSIK
jgi:hypothetical protein